MIISSKITNLTIILSLFMVAGCNPKAGFSPDGKGKDNPVVPGTAVSENLEASKGQQAQESLQNVVGSNVEEPKTDEPEVASDATSVETDTDDELMPQSPIEEAANSTSDAGAIGEDAAAFIEAPVLPPPQLDAPTLIKVESGLEGGHFDLDTSTAIYPFDMGQTDGHVHEYDDKYQTNGADFFRLNDNKLLEVTSVIAPQQRFRIIVANAQLSPGGYLQINSNAYGVVDLQQLGDPNVYKLGSAEQADEIQLSDLKIVFKPKAILNGGLIQSETGCVRRNQPGALGEYRNGALIVQLVDADIYTLDPDLGVAASGLLWEATVFWHEQGCYGK